MLYKVFFTLYAPNELHVSYSGKYLMNERRMSGLFSPVFPTDCKLCIGHLLSLTVILGNMVNVMVISIKTDPAKLV